MAEKKTLASSPPLACPHCANIAPMPILASHALTTSTENDHWESTTTYEVLLCNVCKEVTFRTVDWYDGMESEEDLLHDILYPGKKSSVRGVPAEINAEYDAASKVASVSPNAHAVILGRVLDLVCEDRGAQGKVLHERLNDLAARQEIPAHLASMAHKLRKLRNVGAHANLGTLSSREIPVLDALCRAVLEYVYAAPLLLKEVEARITQLETRQAAKGPGAKPPPKPLAKKSRR
jgi:hypothetical protein